MIFYCIANEAYYGKLDNVSSEQIEKVMLGRMIDYCNKKEVYQLEVLVIQKGNIDANRMMKAHGDDKSDSELFKKIISTVEGLYNNIKDCYNVNDGRKPRR